MDRILIIRYHSSFGGYVKNADLFADFRLFEDRKPLSKITGNSIVGMECCMVQALFKPGIAEGKGLNHSLQMGNCPE